MMSFEERKDCRLRALSEALEKISQGINEADNAWESIKRSGNLDQRNEATEIVNRMDWFPKVSNNFTVRFSWPLANSFKVNVMVDKPWMFSYVAGDSPINTKPGGVSFAKDVGLKTPEIFQTNVSSRDVLIPRGRNVAIKPINSATSMNTFLIVNKDFGVKEVFSEEEFSSCDDFLIKLQNDPRLEEEYWVVQELLTISGLSSPDVKFFCFYGEVKLVLQVDRTSKPRKTCFFYPTGEKVDVGQYPNSMTGRIAEPMFNEADIKEMEICSQKIPTPYSRIDMLATDQGLYFCEFTFNSGSPGGFDYKHDRMLGMAYRKAKMRLFQDLITGKKFDEFARLNSGESTMK